MSLKYILASSWCLFIAGCVAEAKADLDSASKSGLVFFFETAAPLADSLVQIDETKSEAEDERDDDSIDEHEQWRLGKLRFSEGEFCIPTPTSDSGIKASTRSVIVEGVTRGVFHGDVRVKVREAFERHDCNVDFERDISTNGIVGEAHALMFFPFFDGSIRDSSFFFRGSSEIPNEQCHATIERSTLDEPNVRCAALRRSIEAVVSGEYCLGDFIHDNPEASAIDPVSRGGQKPGLLRTVIRALEIPEADAPTLTEQDRELIKLRIENQHLKQENDNLREAINAPTEPIEQNEHQVIENNQAETPDDTVQKLPEDEAEIPDNKVQELPEDENPFPEPQVEIQSVDVNERALALFQSQIEAARREYVAFCAPPSLNPEIIMVEQGPYPFPNSGNDNASGNQVCDREALSRELNSEDFWRPEGLPEGRGTYELVVGNANDNIQRAIVINQATHCSALQFDEKTTCYNSELEKQNLNPMPTDSWQKVYSDAAKALDEVEESQDEIIQAWKEQSLDPFRQNLNSENGLIAALPHWALGVDLSLLAERQYSPNWQQPLTREPLIEKDLPELLEMNPTSFDAWFRTGFQTFLRKGEIFQGCNATRK